jgi:uncharacterized protein YjbI with pentapeptide repeats
MAEGFNPHLDAEYPPLEPGEPDPRDWRNFDPARETQPSFACLDLPRGRFQRARFVAANFTDAFVIRSNFRYASLVDARFDRATLRLADMRDTDLTGANFRYADIRGANFEGATLPANPLKAFYGAQVNDGTKLPAELRAQLAEIAEAIRERVPTFYWG